MYQRFGAPNPFSLPIPYFFVFQGFWDYKAESSRSTVRLLTDKVTDISLAVTVGENNRRKFLRAAKKATRKQGSKMVLFQFDKDDERVRLELLKLKREGYNVLYFFTEERKVRKL